MDVTVNGEAFEAEAEWTVADLLAKLELSGGRLALMMDDEIVPKARFPETPLTEGCRIEIVQMVGGG